MIHIRKSFPRFLKLKELKRTYWQELFRIFDIQRLNFSINLNYDLRIRLDFTLEIRRKFPPSFSNDYKPHFPLYEEERSKGRYNLRFDRVFLPRFLQERVIWLVRG